MNDEAVEKLLQAIFEDPAELTKLLEEHDHERLKTNIEETLKTLTYREREVIKLRYGLGDGHVYSLEEMGRIWKVTRERIRQVQAKAINKLRHPVRKRLIKIGRSQSNSVEPKKETEIKKGTLVVCDHLLPRATIGIVQESADNELYFPVKIIWPENITEIKTVPKSCLTPICNGEVDAIREIAKLFRWKQPW